METTILDLPDEILILIFSYLPLSGRQRARLVCKHWYYLCETESLTTKEVMVVRQHDLQELLNCTFYRKNFTLRLHFVDKPLEDNPFWKKRGPDVKSLVLKYLTCLRGQILSAISNDCINLQSLTIDLDGVTPQKLSVPCSFKMLLRLHLFGTPCLEGYSLDGDALECLTRHTLKLRELCLNCSCQQSVFPALIKLLRQQSCTIVLLNFRYSDFVNDDALESILKVIEHQLTAICLAECPVIDSPALLANFSHLNKIDLSGNLNITNETFTVLFKSLKKLTLVSLRKTFIDDDVLDLVLELKDLKALDISECHSLSPTGLVIAFTQRILLKLQDLRINGSCIVCDDVIETILFNLPNLNRLELNNSYNLTDFSLGCIANNCKLLQKLLLRCCHDLEDLTVSEHLNSMNSLVLLDLQNCDLISSKTISKLELFELETINVTNLEDITPEVIVGLKKSCPSITTIYFNEHKISFKIDGTMETSYRTLNEETDLYDFLF